MKYREEVYQALADKMTPDNVDDEHPINLFDALMTRQLGDPNWGPFIRTVYGSVLDPNTRPDYIEGSPIPQDIGLAADLYKAVQEDRLRMEKEAALLKKRETELKDHLISSISKSDTKGAVGRRFKAIIKQVRKPKFDAAKWPDLYAYIKQHDRFDLLQKRLSDTPIMDMYESGDPLPPGFETMLVSDVSITKI